MTEKWNLKAGTHDESYVVHAFNLPAWIAFGGPNQDINANLWAHGYPALLEAAKQVIAPHRNSPSWWAKQQEGAKRVPGSYPSRLVALYDAIRECEPPKPPSREQVWEQVWEQVARAADEDDASLDEITDRIMALFGDAIRECEPPKPPTREETVRKVLDWWGVDLDLRGGVVDDIMAIFADALEAHP